MARYIVLHGIKIAEAFVPESFGRLTTLGPKFLLPVREEGIRAAHQVCECTCGEIVVAKTATLKNGHRRSCGCLNSDVTIARCTTHGGSGSLEYQIYRSMVKRCCKPNEKRYADYGGRGIRVCDRWLDKKTGFANFIGDMGVRPSLAHSIDREDNDGNYCPENCRWATAVEQGRNQRRNRLISYDGETRCLTAWAEKFGLSLSTLKHRLKDGWAIEKAFKTPAMRRKTSSTS